MAARTATRSRSRDSGIQKYYVDALGTRHAAPRDTVRAIERAMTAGRGPAGGGTLVVRAGSRMRVGKADVHLEGGGILPIDGELPADLPIGYHALAGRRGAPRRLIVAPAACHLPADFATWGWAIQLYAARSRRSWGMGDLADLRWLGRWARDQGAGLALINPLAAPAPTIPQQPSPYFPSSRRFRSPLYLRIEEVEGARDEAIVRDLARSAHRLNRDRLIDRDEIFRLKSRALEAIWTSARERTDDRFEAFRREQSGLREFATFCALAERFGGGWRQWPAEYHRPDSPAVARIARSARIRERIAFHEWLQYLVDRQLARASAALPVMQDLPIGFDASGADAWAFQDVLAHGMSVGAPPDEFNTKGQNWGLPPFVPARLRSAGYEPFVQTIRACLRHAGGLRIDHVMGLFRLFWIPEGRAPRDGAYVESNGGELLSIVALESQRARAVIVGEDLGTVEESTRDAARGPSPPVLPPALVREDAPRAVSRERARGHHDARSADRRRPVVGLRPGRAEGAQPVAERSGHARDPSTCAADDARSCLGAARRSRRQGARGPRPCALTHTHRDARRCDGGGGAAEHAGDP